MDRPAGIFLPDPGQVLLHVARRQHAGGDGELLLPVVPLKFLQGRLYLLRHQADHAHAVLQLEIAVVALLLRQLPARQHVELIAGVDKVQAELRVELPLPGLDLIHNPARLLPGEGLQGVESLPEL